MMTTYTYTIYLGDPIVSEPWEWSLMRGRSLDAVARRILTEARLVARAYGQCQPGDRLWALIWDEDGILVRQAVTPVFE